MLLDQLQTEYRDRFIRLEYVWALKYSPTQARDAKGRWVLDKTGQPLTVYHGSVSPDVTGSKLNPNQPPVRPRSGPNGIYFTSNAQSAYNYIRMPGAGIKGPKGRVIPANIRMNNPLDITDAIKKGQKKGLSFGEAKRKALEDLTPDHDGVIFRGDDYNPDEYIVFSADQIGPVQSIAKKFVEILKYDPNQPRGKGGKWVKGVGTSSEPFVDEDGVMHVGDFVELYHGTSKQRANKILKEGFKIRAVAKQTMGGDSESNRNYIWFAKRSEAAKSYSEFHRYPTVVTVRLPKALYEKLKLHNSGPVSVWSPEVIPAKYIHIQKWDESKHPRDKEGQFAESGVPKEPGTTPIPPGKIRAYHYTEDMDAVEREGLDVTKAKGHTYGEPDAIWFSTEKPGDFKNYVEVFLDPEEVGIGRPSMVVKRNGEWRNAETPEEHQEVLDEYNKGNHNLMVFPKQIKPDRFVTTHRPWHYHYRYLTKDPEQVKAIVAGEYDWGLDNPEYAPAIRAIKAHYGKGKK